LFACAVKLKLGPEDPVGLDAAAYVKVLVAVIGAVLMVSDQDAVTV
jgi:hypothetical protein